MQWRRARHQRTRDIGRYSDARDGRLDDEQRCLMIDGLLQRFLNDLDTEPTL